MQDPCAIHMANFIPRPRASSSIRIASAGSSVVVVGSTAQRPCRSPPPMVGLSVGPARKPGSSAIVSGRQCRRRTRAPCPSIPAANASPPFRVPSITASRGTAGAASSVARTSRPYSAHVRSLRRRATSVSSRRSAGSSASRSSPRSMASGSLGSMVRQPPSAAISAIEPRSEQRHGRPCHKLSAIGRPKPSPLEINTLAWQPAINSRVCSSGR